MTDLCSVRVTHTKNTICARLPVGKKARPAAVLLPIPLQPIHFSRTSSFFADVAPRCPGVLLPGGKSATSPVWLWVTFGEQNRVISRECRSPQAGRLAFQPKFPYFADFLIFATLPLPRSKPPCEVLRHGGLDHGARFTLQSFLATSVCVGSDSELLARDPAKFEVCP